MIHSLLPLCTRAVTVYSITADLYFQFLEGHIQQCGRWFILCAITLCVMYQCKKKKREIVSVIKFILPVPLFWLFPQAVQYLEAVLELEHVRRLSVFGDALCKCDVYIVVVH